VRDECELESFKSAWIVTSLLQISSNVLDHDLHIVEVHVVQLDQVTASGTDELHNPRGRH
jgi:hypothetical protein